MGCHSGICVRYCIFDVERGDVRGKTQKSKRARVTKKAAKAAGLPCNTGHPSHISAGDQQAKKLYWERKYG